MQINATEIGCCLILSNTLCHSCSRACCIVWRPMRVSLTSEQQRLTLPWPAETLWCAGSLCNSLQQKRQPQHQRCFLCKEQVYLQNSKCRQMQVELLCSSVFSHTYNVLCYDGKKFQIMRSAYVESLWVKSSKHCTKCLFLDSFSTHGALSCEWQWISLLRSSRAHNHNHLFTAGSQ